MNCRICGNQSAEAVCAQCGHLASGVDATGTLAGESLTAEMPAISDVRDIPAGHAALVVLRGPQAGEIWTLDNDHIDVGRADDCGLFLDDITVSRHHAFFVREAGVWFLEDRGSLNGSYVNRLLISGRAPLKSGDEIQLGKFRFTFHEATK
jgi:pSer/pThr/pTyr-binding forkhead associated (FHA) protein